MDTRLIISFCTSSFVVSVPKDWIRENKLKKGDVLHVENKKDELIFSAADTTVIQEPKRVFIELENKDLELIRIEIVSAYLNNYDIITISGKRMEEIGSDVKHILRNLSGLEIIQQTADKIVAKDLLNIREISIRTLIRRMDNIDRSMLLDLAECIHEDHFESIYERDVEVNRLCFLAYRTIRAAMLNSKLAKHFAISKHELMFSRQIVTKLEKMGDNAKRTARIMKEMEKLTPKDKKCFKELLNRNINDYLAAMKAYYKNNMTLAYKIESTNKEVIDICNEFKSQKDPTISARLAGKMKSMRTTIKNIARSVIGIGDLSVN